MGCCGQDDPRLRPFAEDPRPWPRYPELVIAEVRDAHRPQDWGDQAGESEAPQYLALTLCEGTGHRPALNIGVVAIDGSDLMCDGAAGEGEARDDGDLHGTTLFFRRRRI